MLELEIGYWELDIGYWEFNIEYWELCKLWNGNLKLRNVGLGNVEIVKCWNWELQCKFLVHGQTKPTLSANRRAQEGRFGLAMN